MQKSIVKIARALFAMCLFVGGICWFMLSLQAWSQGGFIVFTNGEQGKTALSTLIFSFVFVLYGAMDGVKLFHEYKQNAEGRP